MTDKRMAIEDLYKRVTYNPNTGDIHNNRGKKLGSVNSSRRLTVTLDGIKYQASHIAWAFNVGCWPHKRIGFKDDDTLNCAASNLAFADAIWRKKNPGKSSMWEMNASKIKYYTVYNPASGIFRNREKGTVIGRKSTSDTKLLRIDGKDYQGHLMAWLYIHGELPPERLKFVNGNKMDTALDNLMLKSKFDLMQSGELADEFYKQTDDGTWGFVIRPPWGGKHAVTGFINKIEAKYYYEDSDFFHPLTGEYWIKKFPEMYPDMQDAKEPEPEPEPEPEIDDDDDWESPSRTMRPEPEIITPSVILYDEDGMAYIDGENSDWDNINKPDPDPDDEGW